MLVLLLSALLGLVPQQRVVMPAAMLEQEQRTLDLIYNMEFDAALRAAQHLIRALRTQELSPALRGWVELRLGNVHDLQGERQAAQAWYQGVHGDEHAEARAHAYMARPFMPAQIDLKPLEQAAI